MSGRPNFTVFMENVTITSDAQWMAAIQVSYGIPSIILMNICFFIIAIGKRYKQSSFYKLVMFDLLTNFLVYANTWIAIRLEMHPSLVFILKFIQSWVPGLLTLLKYLPYWFFHMHFYTAALLTVHRLTSITMPYQYERLWNRFFPLVVLLACIFSHIPKIFWESWLYEVYIVNGQLICINFPESLKQALNSVGIFSVIYFFINLFNGIYTAKEASARIEAVTTSKSNIKRKLTKIALVYTGAYTSEVIWSVINSLNNYWNFMPNWWASINNNMLVFASDMFTLSLPYILLIFDTNIQKDLRIKKPIDSTHGTFVVVSATNN